ncbi:hypothetical protein BG015_004383 [Linnemannia schmuckeri]|uniref:Uncharacterized protein n=1 Tax=Linnemannia schmuckeri TaxID=64567 RepID=A0A9P5VD31_9FUNG|nr:hypothetical protein BG015_004383 [Linnemannia schmuckeri]
MQTYHELLPAVILSPDPSLSRITVHRDPNRGMYYPCPHPDCDHTSILRTNPTQHHNHCKFVQRDLNAAVAAAASIDSFQPTLARQQAQPDQQTAAIVVPPQQTQQTIRRSQRQLRTTQRDVRQPLSSSSLARLAAAPFPPAGSAPTNITASAFTQLLTTMDQLADKMDRIDKRLGKHTKAMNTMSEQMEWLMDQADEIRSQNASLEAHTESVRIDMGMMEDHLGGLFENTYEFRKELRGLRKDGGKAAIAVKDHKDKDVLRL